MPAVTCWWVELVPSRLAQTQRMVSQYCQTGLTFLTQACAGFHSLEIRQELTTVFTMAQVLLVLSLVQRVLLPTTPHQTIA